MLSKYALYLVRWQLSTPILWGCVEIFRRYYPDMTVATITANFIGGLIFFWVDKKIFNQKGEQK